MAVTSINIGTKRVHLTAYCPTDAVGLIACDFVLAKAVELLNNTSEADLRAWAIQRDPGYAELFARPDQGWSLPDGDDYSIDPTNAEAEAHIVAHLLAERSRQCTRR